MRLFIAREAMDAHLTRILPILSSKTSFGTKFHRIWEATAHYASWYPHQWLYGSQLPKNVSLPAKLKPHFSYVERTAHRLARNLFHGMMIYQQGLEKKQQFLTRLVNIGTDLFGMAVVCSRAASLYSKNPSDVGTLELADLFSRQARGRIEKQLPRLFVNDDRFTYYVAQETLKGKYRWLEDGIVEPA